MKRVLTSSLSTIQSAEESEVLSDAIDELESNFDYVVEGFEKLGREGKEGQNAAQQILLELSSAVENAAKSIAQIITE